jgi:hypothetical protein
MSATLYALVILQGTSGLAFEPGYASREQCLSVYRGPSVWCYEYDPSGVTWTAFFETPAGGFGSVWRFPNESICQNYIAALRPDVPSACRQLAHPEPCPVSCVAPAQPPAPTGSIPNPVPSKPDLPGALTPPPPVTPPPDPASIAPPSDIQIGGKKYTKVAGLTWVERADSFADVTVGPSELQSKDQPSPLPQTAQAEAPKKRVAPRYYDRAPQPLQAFIDTVMLPINFLAYPGRRDW